MLARVAENLYWIGRYIERAECNMRYIREEFLSTLEAPMKPHRDYVIRSILFLRASDITEYNNVPDANVWKNALFDGSNINSIISNINNARENARGIRNTISAELWESINKWYIYCKKRESDQFSLKEITDFSDQMTSHLALIKYSMVNTQVHNLSWHFINMGLMIERSIQISKILKSKISDYNILSESGKNESIRLYQWTILLKAVGAYDVHQTHNRKKLMSPETIFSLMLTNELFPRSIIYSVNRFNKHLQKVKDYINNTDKINSDMEIFVDNLAAFDDHDNEQAVIGQLEEIQKYMSEYHYLVQRTFFQ